MKKSSIKSITLTIMVIMVCVNIVINVFFFSFLQQSNKKLLMDKCYGVANNIRNELYQNIDMIETYSSRLYSETYRLGYFEHRDPAGHYNRRKQIQETIDTLNAFMVTGVQSVIVDYESETREVFSRVFNSDEVAFLMEQYELMKAEQADIPQIVFYAAVDRGEEIWLLTLRICEQYDYDELKYVDQGEIMTVLVVSKAELYEKYGLPTSLQFSIEKTDENAENMMQTKEDGDSQKITVTRSMRIGITTSYDYILKCTLLNAEEVSNFSNMQLLLVIQLGVNVIMIILWIAVMIKFITNPLQKISQHMVTSEHTPVLRMSEDFTCNEMCMVARCYNELVENLNNESQATLAAQERLHKIEMGEKERDIKALQSQINPHFIYNMLENIRVLADMGNVEKVSQITQRVASFLRYSLYVSGFVCLADEIEATMSYLEIMRICYDDRFRVELVVDIDPQDVPIPKMMIQPLIGNVFKHAFSFDGMDNVIRLHIKCENNVVFIVVSDNGRGIEPTRLNDLNEQLRLGKWKETDSGFGLYSINQRVKTIYGDDYGIKLESEFGKQTQVTLSFPASKTNSEVTD